MKSLTPDNSSRSFLNKTTEEIPMENKMNLTMLTDFYELTMANG